MGQQLTGRSERLMAKVYGRLRQIGDQRVIGFRFRSTAKATAKRLYGRRSFRRGRSSQTDTILLPIPAAVYPDLDTQF